MLALRPYQTDANAAVIRHFNEGARGVCLVAPTGAGKTVMGSDLMLRAVEKKRRTLFLAPRSELVTQCYNKLRDCGLSPSVIQAGLDHMTDYANPIQVASKDTFAARIEKHRLHELRFDLIIADECHHVAEGNGWDKILKAYPDARRLGLTATPYRLDGAGLGTHFDQAVVAAQIKDLIAQGFLVPPRYRLGPKPDASRCRVTGGDFNTADNAAVMNTSKINGDAVRVWAEHAGGVRTIAFCVDRKHAAAVCAEFKDHGVSAEYLDGTTDKTERAAILARLKSGETTIVCNVGVLTEGFDEPLVGCIIILRQTMSNGLYIQMGGRGLRLAPGKWECLIIDLAGCSWMHGGLTSPMEVDLSREKRKAKDKDKEATEPMTVCPNETCGWAYPTSELEWPESGIIHCPECGQKIKRKGHRSITVNKSAKVVEVDPEVLERKAATAYRRIVESCFARGQQPVAANFIFKQRFGRFPSKEDVASLGEVRVRWRKNKDTGKNELTWDTGDRAA